MGDRAPDILGGLPLKISVERGRATHESGSVVLVVERFNPKGLAHSFPDELPVTREGFLQGRVQFGRPRQKLDELFLRLARQPNDLYFGYRFLRGLLGGSDNKIANRTPWISAARRTTASASGAMRASRRAVRLVCCSGIHKRGRRDLCLPFYYGGEGGIRSLA